MLDVARLGYRCWDLHLGFMGRTSLGDQAQGSRDPAGLGTHTQSQSL